MFLIVVFHFKIATWSRCFPGNPPTARPSRAACGALRRGLACIVPARRAQRNGQVTVGTLYPSTCNTACSGIRSESTRNVTRFDSPGIRQKYPSSK